MSINLGGSWLVFFFCVLSSFIYPNWYALNSKPPCPVERAGEENFWWLFQILLGMTLDPTGICYFLSRMPWFQELLGHARCCLQNLCKWSHPRHNLLGHGQISGLLNDSSFLFCSSNMLRLAMSSGYQLHSWFTYSMLLLFLSTAGFWVPFYFSVLKRYFATQV